MEVAVENKRLDDRASELESLERDASKLNLIEFWKQRVALEALQPRNAAQAYCWHWADIRPRLELASEIVPIEDCERRALVLANPGLGGKPHVVDNLFAAYSIYNAKETAPVHRHTPCASRFVVEGQGGYTIVEGEKCEMHRGDLIITPAGTWHDHGNEGQTPLVWMDVLDLPIVDKLNLTFFEFDFEDALADRSGAHPMSTGYQKISEPSDNSQNLYGVGGMLPLFSPQIRGLTGNHSPQFVYRWEAAKAALEKMAGYDGSPYEGIIMEYVNPHTGKSVMPNMAFRVQMLRPGEETLLRRRLASGIYFCLDGEGYIESDGKKVEWGPNDAFSMPSWQWSRFVNTSDRNAFLYSVSDEPLVRAMGLYREDRKLADGSVQQVVWSNGEPRIV